MGWLFEAPNPYRRGRSWRGRLGLTRGETQGTSLALFLRCFAICLVGYALTFKVLEWFDWHVDNESEAEAKTETEVEAGASSDDEITLGLIDVCTKVASRLLHKFGKVFYVSFFSVVHLMKLHSLSLIWGVTSETMEYEEQAEIRECRLRIRQKELMRKNGNGGGNDLNINQHNSGYTCGQVNAGS